MNNNEWIRRSIFMVAATGGHQYLRTVTKWSRETGSAIERLGIDILCICGAIKFGEFALSTVDQTMEKIKEKINGGN